MALVPMVGLGLGSVAGLGAARLVASHYSVMVKEIAAVFVASPPVLELLGEPRTKQELGGWEIQTTCGAVDRAIDTEEQAFDATRKFLSSCPAPSTTCRSEEFFGHGGSMRGMLGLGDPAPLLTTRAADEAVAVSYRLMVTEPAPRAWAFRPMLQRAPRISARRWCDCKSAMGSAISQWPDAGSRPDHSPGPVSAATARVD
jgi:hypothetical protein